MHSSETRRKISQTLLGHSVSTETRRKISQSRKGTVAWNKGIKRWWDSPTEFREGLVPWNKGKKGVMPVPWNKGCRENLSDEARQKMVLAHRNKPPWNKGKHPYLERPSTLKKIAEARLRQVFPTKDTEIEALVQQELRSRGVSFTTHYPIAGQPDIFIVPRTCIFCDGDYWHGIPTVRTRDERTTASLTELGYTVLRLQEHEIQSDLKACVDRVEAALNKRGIMIKSEGSRRGETW